MPRTASVDDMGGGMPWYWHPRTRTHKNPRNPKARSRKSGGGRRARRSPRPQRFHVSPQAGSAGRAQTGAGGPAGSAGQVAQSATAHAGSARGAWVLAGTGTGGSLTGFDSLDRLPGISGVLLDLVGEGHIGLGHALSAWQREQERVVNRTWRRPGGLARMGGL
jgi:hypothetical protein